MMFIIANKNPHEAVQYLIKHTNKRFYFKQLIELGQLICSAGFSAEYKTVNRGKDIQNWIKRHPVWTYLYYKDLLFECKDMLRLPAYQRAVNIKTDLLLSAYDSNKFELKVETAIFRYKKTYNAKYPTNSELPIELACKEYINYIAYKMEQEAINGK